jgi:hypothetical protein
MKIDIDIYCKGLAQAIMEAGKSQDLYGGQQARNPGLLMV